MTPHPRRQALTPPPAQPDDAFDLVAGLEDPPAPAPHRWDGLSPRQRAEAEARQVEAKRLAALIRSPEGADFRAAVLELVRPTLVRMYRAMQRGGRQ